MPTTVRTDTSSARSALPTPTTMPTAHVRPRLRIAVASESALNDSRDLTSRFDRQVHPALDTSDDPTGAAIVWPFVMLLIYVVLGLGFVVAR